MFANLTGWQPPIMLAGVLLMFGALKQAGLAKSLGQSMCMFKSEVRRMKSEAAGPGAQAPTAVVAPATTLIG